MKIKDLKIKDTFHSIFHTDREILNAVVEDMKKNGYDTAFPVSVWDDVVIDGHTRVLAAEMAGIEVIPVEKKDFDSEKEAIEYAIHNQRDRRNLSDADLLACIEFMDVRKTTGGTN